MLKHEGGSLFYFKKVNILEKGNIIRSVRSFFIVNSYYWTHVLQN